MFGNYKIMDKKACFKDIIFDFKIIIFVLKSIAFIRMLGFLIRKTAI
jgi:hypothetical protein